ncbi:MAG: hypothetical protein IMW90_19140 [Thermogemmatispora sp.]|nr:hypothetical protein [Thermogemmatispora sp.]
MAHGLHRLLSRRLLSGGKPSRNTDSASTLGFKGSRQVLSNATARRRRPHFA